MATIKAYTDLEQSLKLAEILPLESADMCWTNHCYGVMRSSMTISAKTVDEYKSLLDRFNDSTSIDVFYPAWSLAALLSLIKDKCGYFEFVYLKRTYDGRANPLEDVYRLSTDEYDVYNKEAVDACYEMILKLHELNLL